MDVKTKVARWLLNKKVAPGDLLPEFIIKFCALLNNVHLGGDQ